MGGFCPNPKLIPFDGPTTRQTGALIERESGYSNAVITEWQPVAKGEFSAQTDPLRRQRVPLTLRINTSELTLRVQQQKGALRKPEAWADELHGGLARALQRATRKHLIEQPPLGLTPKALYTKDEKIEGSLQSVSGLKYGRLAVVHGLTRARRLATAIQ